ncbi:hypothetical protein FQN57_001595 [Myotisia sp. PD_48]|nr:hypothetical protein FQN57_001595 [Myotisia sp. PD_48]
MANNEKGDAVNEKQLKAMLWHAVGTIAHEQTNMLQADPTPQFLAGLSELIWTQIESVSQDLEMFAKHAGRSTINVSDILLLARRNSGLESILRAYADKEEARKSDRAAGNP